LTSALFTTQTDEQPAVKLEVWSPKAGEKPSFEDAKKQKYKPAQKGDTFGPSCE
jgi:alpha-mannosidase